MTDLKRIPFNEKEMTPLGEWKAFGPDSPGTPILDTPVTARENTEAFLAGRTPLWMPNFLEFKMFMPAILPDNTAKGMVSEYIPFPFDKFGGPDFFGVEWEFVPQVMGAMVRPGNPKVPDICEWEKYIQFPDLDAYDWAGSAAANEDYLNNDRRAIQMTVFSGLFERLISFLDMGGALVALVDEDEKPAVHRLFDRLCEFYDELFCRFAKWYQPTLLWFHDDWGSQRAPLFSLDTCREMIVPYMKRVVDSAHKYGIGFELHCCGKNELLVPAMIEAGVDMWAGQDMNDKAMLYREYGQDIKLGVNPDPLPPDATEQQIRDNAKRFLDAYPTNAYLGLQFGADGRNYTYVYEESRKRYSPL